MFSGRYPSVGAARREAADGLSHRIRTEFYAPDAQHRHQGGPACRHHHQPCQPGFGTPERGSQGRAIMSRKSTAPPRSPSSRRCAPPTRTTRSWARIRPAGSGSGRVPVDHRSAGRHHQLHPRPAELRGVDRADAARPGHAGVHLRSVAQRTIHRQPWRRHLPERPPRARLGPHPLPRRAAGRPLAQLGRHGAGLGAFPQDGRKQRGVRRLGATVLDLAYGLRSPGRFAAWA